MTPEEPDPDTNTSDETAVRPPHTPRPVSEAVRFTPGTTLAGRYRIIAPLGKGGMGEVYRADDTRLGQPVALKFLPAALASDAQRLERLVDEVRIGRQISHPNVCRLYDIAEAEERVRAAVLAQLPELGDMIDAGEPIDERDRSRIVERARQALRDWRG